MGGLHSRNKGKRGERDVIGLLQPVINEVYEAHGLEAPVLKRNTMQSDGGGFDLHGLEWLAIEVKHCAKPAVAAWWQQTLSQCGQHQTAVLFYKIDRRGWTVRVWGFLERTGQTTHCIPVAISAEDWLQWFRTRLNHELSRQG